MQLYVSKLLFNYQNKKIKNLKIKVVAALDYLSANNKKSKVSIHYFCVSYV